MTRLFDALARRLLRRGMRRALADGSYVWLGVTALAAVMRLLFKEQRPKIQREELAVGETIIVSHLPAPSRRSSPGAR